MGGVAQGFDGVNMPAMTATVWQLGSAVDVAWAIAANHGGGYSYRLCKKSETVSEECFQRTPLKFAGDTSFIINPNGSTFEFPMTKVTTGTWPEGSEWARDPIPGCKICDSVLDKCGAPLDAVPLDQSGGGYTDPWNTQVDCYGACCGSSSSKAHGVCPDGTEFYPAVSGHSGFGKNVPKWSIMDKVLIPADLEEGDYLLSWRWDCEESTQIWQNCADIHLTKGTPPPSPAPSPPAPTPPAPSPSPGKNDYVCYKNKCYEKPGYGTMAQATCEKTCSTPAPPSPSPSPGKGDYFCKANKCYEKPGYGTMDQATCEKTCSTSVLPDMVV